MKTKFFLALSAIALVTSCSNDEVIEMSDSNAIKFSVSSGKMSRAAQVYCANNLPGSFKVWANQNITTTTGGTSSTDVDQYIVSDVITKKEENNVISWTNSGGLRYWPTTENTSLSFYASAGHDISFSGNDLAKPIFDDFEVSTAINQQEDLLYAVKLDQTKAEGTVDLNFRHALSQIVFKAKNTNSNISVEISEIKIKNVQYRGDYELPSVNTDGNVNNHDNSGSGTYPTTGMGEWTQTTDKTDFAVTFNPAQSIPSGGNVTNLTDYTDNDAATTTDWKDVMLLLPQTITPWDAKSTTIDVNDNGTNGTGGVKGTYFLLTCKIYNNVNGTDKINLHNGDVAIPIANTDWEQGKKYIYTFIFGEGNGGYDPDKDDDNDGKNDPILTPITYEVTVDDFVNANGETITMNKPANP